MEKQVAHAPDERIREEVRRNYRRFQELLPDLLEEQKGKIALIRSGKIVAFYNTRLQARAAGDREFPDGLWSMQEVTEESLHTGYKADATIGAIYPK